MARPDDLCVLSRVASSNEETREPLETGGAREKEGDRKMKGTRRTTS